MLSDAMAAYVNLRHAAGFKFKHPATLLKSYVAFAEARGDAAIRVKTVLDWVSSSSSVHRRRFLLLTVRRAALFLHAEDTNHEVPAVDALGRVQVGRRSPYIYTPDEIIRLMQAAASLPPVGSIKSIMYQTLIGLLAATGMRISEALALQCEDITEDGLIIKGTKFNKSRIVPIHLTTRKAIDAYMLVRMRQNSFDDFLFISKKGRVIPYMTVHHTFLHLAQSIGLREEPGKPGPRIHDLRHTFATRSLERCGLDRTEVTRHIVALGTYLGHVNIASTYWYLEATPIVLKQIAEAGEALHRGDIA